jgi:hypothetical protein
VRKGTFLVSSFEEKVLLDRNMFFYNVGGGRGVV